MAIDNSLYEALEENYFTLKTYLETTPLTREHSPILLQHETLASLLERLDIEAIEEQSKTIDELHENLNAIKKIVQQTTQDIKENKTKPVEIQKLQSSLDSIFQAIDVVIV